MIDGTPLIRRPRGVVGDEPWESVEFASAQSFGVAPEQLGDRVLATVLFRHNERIRASIDRFRGRSVLVSGTTRDLLDGSGFALEPRGEYELKGLSGARPVYALRR